MSLGTVYLLCVYLSDGGKTNVIGYCVPAMCISF